MKQISTLTSLLTLLAMMVSPALYGQWQNQSHAQLWINPRGTAMENPKPFITFNNTWMTDQFGDLYPPQFAEVISNGVLNMKFLYNESNWNIHFIRIFVIDEDDNETEMFARHGTDRIENNVSRYDGTNWTTENAVIPDGEFEFSLDLTDPVFDDPFTKGNTRSK